MVSDHDRRELYAALERELGTAPAATLMELLPPVGWADVARQSDLVALRGEMAELRAELKGEMAELRGEMAELRAELKGEMAELRGKMAKLEGQMAELRGEYHALLPRVVAANIGSMLAFGGFIVAVAAFVR